MRISGHDAIRLDNVIQNNGVSSDIQKSEQHTRISQTEDKVEFSARAKDIQRIKEILAEVPDIRQDKVEAAREALVSGTLNLRGKDLAEKIITDSLYNIR